MQMRSHQAELAEKIRNKGVSDLPLSILAHVVPGVDGGPGLDHRVLAPALGHPLVELRGAARAASGERYPAGDHQCGRGGPLGLDGSPTLLVNGQDPCGPGRRLA